MPEPGRGGGLVQTRLGGVPGARITMLLDREGDLMLKYTVDVRVGTHPDAVLEDCIRLFDQ